MNEARHGRLRTSIAVGVGAPLLLMTGAAVGAGIFNVTVPFIPSVGGNAATQCDQDGAAVAFTYGNSRANGVKVNEAKVTGIASECAQARVEFYNASATMVTSVSATPVSGVATMNPNIWTDEFTEVRVVLLP